MPDDGTERVPDPRVAFTNVTAADTGEVSESPGMVDRAVVVAGEGEHLPPHSEQAIDSRPLSQRFIEPEE
ncbi:hypothetical protein AB0O34_23770 [Sphaerisporangium sp. NPDC088356]|uniref:hypothetical protein n=1 Tax=Sphaerisporangium sp. NPDC088356 TaxID=3154871 RepID=UPI003438262B